MPEAGTIVWPPQRRQEDGRYSASDIANLFRLQGVERSVLRLLSRHGVTRLRDKRILEVGCGTGYWVREFVKWGAEPAAVTGLDLREDLVAVARKLCPPETQLLTGNGADLPFPDGEFDLVGLFTVFTSLLDPELRSRVASETVRVLKPRGLALWYDFYLPNPRNHDVRPVSRREIATLFPGCRVTLQRASLAPPVTRAVARRSWIVCTLLDAIPLFRTHYLGVIRKP
jgi:ubiquinone/menaquinone biosynthesis C-methylase UbiE